VPVLLQIDARQISDLAEAVEQSVTDRQYTRALNAAINRVGRSATTQAKRDLRKATDIKTDRLDAAITETRSNFESLQYVVTGSGRPLPLSYFDVRQGRKGVSARAFGRREVYRGTFLATVGSGGHQGVFKRDRERARRVKRVDPGGRVYYSQLPIIELAGPSVPRAMASAAIRDGFARTVLERLPIEFERELNRVVQGFRGKEAGVTFDED